MRDDALIGAQQVAINLNNADSANLDQSIENMRSSVTGDEMTTYLQTVQDSITDELRNSGSKADTEVVQSALTELNTDDRTATALVVVRVTTTQQPVRQESARHAAGHGRGRRGGLEGSVG